jgi:uncharacterized protein YjbI with pentapeptide repeats
MANAEHLKILKQGVKVWNQWRREHVIGRPDLSGADLSGVDLDDAHLAGADLSRAQLIGAHLSNAGLWVTDLGYAQLSGADLSRANLNSSDLTYADLRDADLSSAHLDESDLDHAQLNRANLSRADLHKSHLTYADLTDTDLSRANLGRANLSHAELGGADFTGVALMYTIFADNDLSEIKGLETVRHLAPSSVGIDTIYKSKGNIPEVFLRGSGVPESFIVQMHALIASTEPIQFYSCFISYSRKNQLFADRLYADLQNKGVRCWLATEDLKIGDKTRIRIDESIRLHDKLLLVLSKYSVASDWVEQEVETALERERREKRTVLFPIRLDDTVMKIDAGWPALIRNTRNIGDFRKCRNPEAYSQAFDRLLRDLKAGK